jgi:hypothetical protein
MFGTFQLSTVLFDPLGSEHDALPGDCRGGSVRGAVVKFDRTAVLFDPLGSNVNDIETKGQTFRYRSILLERKQNVLVWSAYYRNESKTCRFGPKICLL